MQNALAHSRGQFEAAPDANCRPAAGCRETLCPNAENRPLRTSCEGETVLMGLSQLAALSLGETFALAGAAVAVLGGLLNQTWLAILQRVIDRQQAS